MSWSGEAGCSTWRVRREEKIRIRTGKGGKVILFTNWNFPRMQNRTVLLSKVPKDFSQVVEVLYFI